MSNFDLDRFMNQLRELDALRDEDSIQSKSTDRKKPIFKEGWPAGLNPEVRRTAEKAGVARLYRHQYEAIEKSLSGSDVVLESPTASGKTLAFTLPMLHALKEEPYTHALMIYPMKALALDQLLQLWELTAPLGMDAFTYDGDTDSNEKAKMSKNPPHILLTNPEYLNMSFLAYQDKWKKFLLRLKYVVIDEMHLYRGYFGCNMALLLRRFFRHLKRLGVSPRVFLSTATCENPQEHAENLLGREVEMVSARDSFRPKRHFVFVKPDTTGSKPIDIHRKRVVNAALAAMKEKLQTLIFCPTKRYLENAVKECKKKAKEMGMDPDRAVTFHADMKAQDKQEIQKKIQDGEIDAVFSTNALELGIDIGGLDGVILAGFPPSVMSAWQQIGRAGRGWDKDAFVLLYAMSDPIDQFFAGKLDAFLNKGFDRLVIDPANEEIMDDHLPALMHEIGGRGGLRMSDMSALGEAFFEKARKDGGDVPKFPPPAIKIKLRGVMGKSYDLKRNGAKIGQISEMRRFREAYIGAIFTFLGQNYVVKAHESQAVVLEESPHPHHKTDASFYYTLSTQDLFDGRGYKIAGFGDQTVQTFYGSMTIVMNLGSYKVIHELTDDVMEAVDMNQAHFINNLHFVSINLPKGDAFLGGVGALEHLIRVGAMFVIPADRFDASTYSTVGKGSEEAPTAYYYENHPGGIGIAKKLFKEWPTALQKGIEIAENCKCLKGCQNCIVPPKSHSIGADIDKTKGIPLAKALLAAAKNGPTHTFKNGMMVSV